MNSPADEPRLHLRSSYVVRFLHRQHLRLLDGNDGDGGHDVTERGEHVQNPKQSQNPNLKNLRPTTRRISWVCDRCNKL